MAGLRGVLDSGAVSLAQNTTLTLVQLVAPTNQRLKVLYWGISTSGATPQEAGLRVQLLKQTTAGTASSLTIAKFGGTTYPETLQATAQQTFTAEPTAGAVLAHKEIPTYVGNWDEWFPYDLEPPIAGGERVGIRVISPATMVTLNVVAMLRYEE